MLHISEFLLNAAVLCIELDMWITCGKVSWWLGDEVLPAQMKIQMLSLRGLTCWACPRSARGRRGCWDTRWPARSRWHRGSHRDTRRWSGWCRRYTCRRCGTGWGRTRLCWCYTWHLEQRKEKGVFFSPRAQSLQQIFSDFLLRIKRSWCKL